jgi:hypothetical protein
MCRHVRFWPKADIPSCTAHVRFQGQSGHGLMHCKCLLLTQSGHSKNVASRSVFESRSGIAILQYVVEDEVAQPDPAFGGVGSFAGLQQRGRAADRAL